MRSGGSTRKSRGEQYQHGAILVLTASLLERRASRRLTCSDHRHGRGASGTLPSPTLCAAKESDMPKFVTIAYGDEAGYVKTELALREKAHARDAELRQGGALIGIAGKPVQVRNTEFTGVTREAGSFLSSALPIAGFGIIDAADLDEAIALVSQTPCAVCHGVVEVWPLDRI
jgi:hypothetical protein